MIVFAACAVAFSFGCLAASVGFYWATKRAVRKATFKAEQVLVAMDRGHLLRVIDKEEAG